MKNRMTLLTATAAATAGITIGAPALHAQDATTAHYAITDNNIYRAPNSATVFRLSGSNLVGSPALQTTGWGLDSAYFGTNMQTAIKVGTNVCVFVADPGSDDIAAFNTTNFSSPTHVGNYVDPSGSGAYTGIALATRGTTLFAGYSASVNIGVWTINSDCSLTLAGAASNTPTPAPVDALAVTPNGKTLVATYAQTTPGVGSFAVSGATLTAKGPYNTTGNTGGVDITKDSKYAIIADFSENLTQVEIFPINSDSSLGSDDFYNITGGGFDSSNLWLSPDETVLYVSNNISLQITTLTYSESAAAGHRLAFSCLSSVLKNPTGGSIYYTSGLATEAATGKGGYLYVAEPGNPPAVALMQIPSNGCPTEVTGSPFVNSPAANGFPVTVTAYPPRPF
jgi:hypothetical protein